MKKIIITGVALVLIISGVVVCLGYNLKKENKPVVAEETLPILANKALDEAVTNFLLSKQDFSWKTEEGSTNFCVFQNLYPEKELFPIYIWIRCGEFKMVEGELKELSGMASPVKIDYPNELSYYDIEKFSYEKPGDGSLYDKDMKRIFPEEIWPRMSFDLTALNNRILEAASQALK